MSGTGSDADDKQQRVVAARMKLRERFEAKMAATPSLADDRPMGQVTPNRHGMPRVPPGQYVTKKWPVLDLGTKPRIDPATWSLRIDGAVARPLTLSFGQLRALPQVTEASDFHCVTTWSKMDMVWTGVRLAEVLAMAEPTDAAGFVFFTAADRYTTNLPLEDALKAVRDLWPRIRGGVDVPNPAR